MSAKKWFSDGWQRRTWSAVKSWLRSWHCEPDIRNHPTYEEQHKWLREEFQKEAGSISEVAADHSLTYAWKVYDDVTAAIHSLNSKANNLMRNAGLAVGLTAAILGFAVDKPIEPTATQAFWVGATVALFVASMVLAAIASKPVSSEAPTRIRDLLDDIRRGIGTKPYVSASIHIAVTAQRIVAQWQSRQILRAMWFFIAGLTSLLAMLLALFA